MTSLKCRAKNPSACVDPACPEKRGHANQISRAIKEKDIALYIKTRSIEEKTNEELQVKQEALKAVVVPAIRGSLTSIPAVVKLKDLDSEGLTNVISYMALKHIDKQAQDQLDDSMNWATYLHEGVTRKNPVKKSDGTYQATSPYIMHPLRNTLRLSLMGVRDKDVLTASVLHDTVEDAPEKMSGLPADASPHDHREAALEAVESRYGKNVRRMVENVSNPIIDRKAFTREEFNKMYSDHVEEVIMSDSGTYLVKVSDFIDNALSLHHNSVGASMNARLAKKYAPVVAVMQEAFSHHKDELRTILSEQGISSLEKKLDGAFDYLTEMSASK